MKQGRACQVPEEIKNIYILEDLEGRDHFLLAAGGMLMEKVASGESLMDGKAFGGGDWEDTQRGEQTEHKQRTARTSTWPDIKMESGKGGWTVEGPKGRSRFNLYQGHHPR